MPTNTHGPSTAEAIAIAARRYGVDSNTLRSCVCYHEAAHVAIALHYGCTVEAIDLTDIPGSLARAHIVQGRGGRGIFVQMTAGPLCDRQRNHHYQFPESFLAEIEYREEMDFERELRRKLPHLNSKQINDQWTAYTGDAQEIMALPRTQAFIDALATRLIVAVDTGERLVAGKEIMLLWNQQSVGSGGNDVADG